MKVILMLILIFISSCSPYKQTRKGKDLEEIFKSQSIKTPLILETEVSLGEATTRIIDTGENRVSNISLACEKVSGVKLLPGEEFSFNKLTGKKTKANGYKYAPVLIDGEKSYGIGGGVCQVSTTIYMAALNAGLEISEHHNHSEPVMYAPEGMDATVVFGVKDFKFKNNTENDLYIYVWVSEEKVFSKIVKKELEIIKQNVTE